MLGGQNGESATDMFAIKDLWTPSIFTVELENVVNRGTDQFGLGGLDFSKLEQAAGPKAPDLRLPALDTFNYGLLEDISAPESVGTNELDLLELPDEESQDVGEDIWLTQNELPTTKPGPRLWARFYDPSYEEPIHFLSEAGPLAFSAALEQARKDDQKEPATIIQTPPMIQALALLGLGLESLLFEYHDKNHSFESRFNNVVVAGLSLEIMDSITADFMTMGNNVRRLHWYVQWCFESSRSTPTKIALAGTIRTVLDGLRQSLVQAFPLTTSLLQLQHLFSRPRSLLKYILEALRTTRDLRSQEDILSKLFDLAQECELQDTWAQPLMLELLSRASSPWLVSLGASLGLRPADRADEEFSVRLQSKVAEAATGGDQDGTEALMPSFIESHVQQDIVHACSSLALLKQYHPDHILSLPDRNQFTQGPSLEWLFSWADIERVQQKALDYEARIQAAMKARLNYGSFTAADVLSNDNQWVPYGKSDIDLKRSFESTYDVLDALPAISSQSTEPLRQCLEDILRPSSDSEINILTFSPPLSIAPAISFGPIIASQSKIINHACLRMMFKKYDLANHLSLQHQFQLLGSGLFSTRLSESLFSSSLDSAERQKDHVRVGNFGLRLSIRKTWPPQTSELQLALAGVLSDSHDDENMQSSNLSSPSSFRKYPQTTRRLNKGMPGDLSWSVRHLSEAEAEACLQQHSLYALDFLRLQYRAPAPLDSIISEDSLEKYDSIFKLLLRVLRLLFVTKHLSSSAVSRHKATKPVAVESRFRIEATHFVNTVADYFFHSVIATTWKSFWDKIVDLDTRLSAVDGFDNIRENESVYSIKQMHDQMLDRMRFGLLTRYKQKDAAQLLMEIFELVLGFARRIDDTSDADEDTTAESDVEALYKRYATKLKEFISACTELSLKPGIKPGDTTDENTIEQLIFRLDMNGWYSKRGGL